MRWLLLAPTVFLLLFGCGEISLLSARVPAYANTTTGVRANYRPWPFAVFKPLDPSIIGDIQRDMGLYPGTYSDASAPGLLNRSLRSHASG